MIISPGIFSFFKKIDFLGQEGVKEQKIAQFVLNKKILLQSIIIIFCLPIGPFH